MDEKTLSFREEKSVPPRQCTYLFVRRCNSEIGRFTIRIGATSALFSGFGSLRLFSLPKHKQMVDWEEIFIKWRGYRRNRGLFSGLEEILYSGGLKKVGKFLGEVYWTKRRDCWEIVSKKCIFHPKNIWLRTLSS